jgi:hypothetical protein
MKLAVASGARSLSAWRLSGVTTLLQERFLFSTRYGL